MNSIIDQIHFFCRNVNELEKKLSKYQGYTTNSIIEWKKQTGLSWSIITKLLRNFEIYDAQKIRSMIKKIVDDNEHIFSQPNCYITGFGNTGKSGDVILYDFSHTTQVNQSKIKKTWELNTLPSNSTIIFVEDIIGTGTQSVDYVQNKVNQFLKPSHKPYLLSLCATPAGIKNLTENTHFKVLIGTILDEEYQHYSVASKIFTEKEKKKIIEVNKRLKKEGAFDFDLGLLIAFYFTIPNNAMPIFWKDGYPYKDNKGIEKKWHALLPRKF